VNVRQQANETALSENRINDVSKEIEKEEEKVAETDLEK